MNNSDTVAIGFCHSHNSVTGEWRNSYTQLLQRDAYTHRRIVAEHYNVTGGTGIPRSRCTVVKEFLEAEHKADWLFFMDTDASFDSDILDVLLQDANPETMPILGGLAFKITYDKPNAVGASMFHLEPTMYRYQNGNYYTVLKYPMNAVIQVTATGCHCLLIHRSVLENPLWHEDGYHQPWFRMWTKDGQELSEDLYFCDRAIELGYPIHVSTKAKTGHVKQLVIDEDLYVAMNPEYLNVMQSPNWPNPI